MKKNELKKVKVKPSENDKKIKKSIYKKYLLIFLCLGVIVLEVLALFNVIDMLWGCGLFLLIAILKKII